jgi:hypothetical protein
MGQEIPGNSPNIIMKFMRRQLPIDEKSSRYVPNRQLAMAEYMPRNILEYIYISDEWDR